MATKTGRVEQIERTGRNFVRLRLSTGDTVELPNSLWAAVQSDFAPEQVLVFVERRGRVFRFVHWVGTAEQAVTAVNAGWITTDEYMSADIYEELVAAAVRRSPLFGQPWAEEVVQRQLLARGSTLDHRPLWEAPNPYFCLSFESLVRYRFATTDEIAQARRAVQRDEYPREWWNGRILRDLEVLDSREDALVRIGLWLAQQKSTQPADEDVTPDRTERAVGENARHFALIQAKWPEVVATVSRHPPTKAVIELATPLRVEGNVLLLGFPSDHAFMRDAAERRGRTIQQGISHVAGLIVALDYQILDPSDESVSK